MEDPMTEQACGATPPSTAYEAGEDEGCGYSYDHKTVEDERDGLIVWTCTECGAEGFEESGSGEVRP